MKKEIDKKIFVGILISTLFTICLLNNLMHNEVENEIDKGTSLKNESLYIEERENDVIYIGGEGKIEGSDLNMLLATNNLLVSDIVNLIIGNEITEIGYNCINSYKYLETLRLGDKVSCIRNGAILNCLNLKYIFIPKSIEKVGTDFLHGCAVSYVVTNGTADVINEKLKNITPLFIFEKIDSYDSFKTNAEESSIPYQSFSTALGSSDPEAGNNPIKLHGGYTQYGPYATIEKGSYTIVVQGQNLDKVKNDNIYISVPDSDVEVVKEDAKIESDKITYEVSFSALASSVELCIYNDSSDGEIIEIRRVDIYLNDFEPPSALDYWWI